MGKATKADMDDFRREMDTLKAEIDALLKNNKTEAASSAPSILAPPKVMEPAPVSANTAVKSLEPPVQSQLVTAPLMPVEAKRVVKAPELPPLKPLYETPAAKLPIITPRAAPAAQTAVPAPVLLPLPPAEIKAKEPQKKAPPVYSSRDPVGDLQRVLNALGYPAGEEDGKLGSGTRKAAEAFVLANNEHAGKNDWPSSSLRPDAPVEKILNAARAELVDRTFGRVNQLKDESTNQSEIRGLQRNLKALGFYDGNLDGKRGGVTDGAIKEFMAHPYLPPLQKHEGVLLTGHSYEGRKAPTHYIPDSKLAKFDMPVESLRPYANEEGWVGYQVAQEWGLTKNGASMAAGQIGFYNIKTGEKKTFSMMAGGGSSNIGSGSAHEWQRNASTPGLVETDHVPGDSNVTYVANVESHQSGHRFGFFTKLSNPYAGKSRDDDIGIHMDVGPIGSHGCPNVQSKDKDAFKAKMKETKVKHFVTFDPDVAKAKEAPQRQSSLIPNAVKSQVAAVVVSENIGKAQEAGDIERPQVADARTARETARG